MRCLVVLALLVFSACAPTAAPLSLPEDCLAEQPAEQLVAKHWLLQPQVWRLRQTVLLEIGPKKIPLEGFLRLDLKQQEARLLAMNEMGVVLFDLQVNVDDQKMLRGIPQLQEMEGLAQGVAQSLRRIFLIPRPEVKDQLESQGSSQRLSVSNAGSSLGFVFDCQGDLRETRQKSEVDDWRVVYDQYRFFGDFYLPEKILMNDFRHRVKLSLWLREVKQEP